MSEPWIIPCILWACNRMCRISDLMLYNSKCCNMIATDNRKVDDAQATRPANHKFLGYTICHLNNSEKNGGVGLWLGHKPTPPYKPCRLSSCQIALS